MGGAYTDLLLLSPGVTQDPRGLTSGSNGDLSYGGIRGYNTSFLVDGTDNNNGFYAQASGRYRAPYQFSDEVMQEFRVQSSGYGAESGRAGGAVVNVVTKSGSNRWHGTTFYHLRDSELGGAAPPFVGFNPSNEQQQFGATIGGPIQRSKTFFFAGYDQHIFNVPEVVEFYNGQTVVVPQVGVYPTPGDYEVCDPAIGGSACDQAIVPGCPPPTSGAPPCTPPVMPPAAAQLSTMGGTFHAQLLGETGFLKLDRVLSPHQFLSARLSTSRSYGANNVYFDPGSPITFDSISANGQEDVTTESASLALLSGISPRLTSHLRVQFSLDLEQSFPNTTGPQSGIYDWMEDFGQSSTLPRETREHRLQIAETFSLTHGRNQLKFGVDGMRTWDYNFYPSLFGGDYFFDNISVNPLTFVPMAEGLELTPVAGVCAHHHAQLELGCGQLDGTARQPGALLRSKFRQSRIAPGRQRLCRVCAGHGSADAALQPEHGSALRPADVFDQGNGRHPAVAAGGKDAVARRRILRRGWESAMPSATTARSWCARDSEFSIPAFRRFTSRRSPMTTG